MVNSIDRKYRVDNIFNSSLGKGVVLMSTIFALRSIKLKLAAIVLNLIELIHLSNY